MLARIGFFLVVFSATAAAQPATAPATNPPAASSSPKAPASSPVEPSTTVAQSSGLFDRVRIGARLGANFASVETNPGESSAFMKAGMVVGGFATVSLWRLFEVELGLGYSQRGFHLEPATSTQSDVTVALDYYEAPALLRARIPWGRTPAHIRLTAGVNVLLLDSARSSDNDEMNDIEDQVSNTDVALVVAAGLDFTFSGWVGFFDVRHDRGMIDTAADQDGFEIYNRVTSLQVGAAF